MPKAFPFRVEWTQTAVRDLAAIVDYISEESTENARSVLKKLEETAEKLATMPLRGRIVFELAAFGIRIYRQLVHARWRIICRVSGKKVYVMAVLDSRRNLEDILLERLVRD